MTAPVAKQRFEARMAEIDDVVVSEAARWSQNENQPKSRETWLAACQSCLDFIDQRTAYMKKSYQDRGWYPTINAPLAFIGGVEADARRPPGHGPRPRDEGRRRFGADRDHVPR